MGTTLMPSRQRRVGGRPREALRADTVIGWLRGGPARPALGSLLGVALLIAACAAPEASSVPASSELPDESPTPTPTQTATSTPSPTVSPTEPPPPQNFIAWILNLAPGSPDGPPEFKAYRHLMNVGGDGCVALAAGLQPGGGIQLTDTPRLLYGGVADACMAAFYGHSDLWSSAAASFAALPSLTSCMDVVAYRVLRDLLQAHQANPSGSFVALIDPGQAETPPCPVVTQLNPDHGPVGTRVRISGFNLDHVHQLQLFYEDHVQGRFDRPESYDIDGDALLVTMDEDDADWACIVPQGAENWNGSGMRFTFDPPPAPGPTGTAAPALVPTALCPPESVE